MGKHSSRGSKRSTRARKPSEIKRLEPRSRSRETPKEQVRRRKESQTQSTQSRQRRRQRRRRVVAGCATVLLVVVVGLAVAVMLYFRGVDRRLIERRQQIDPAIEEVLQETPREPEKPVYVLLLGSDVRPGETVARADTIMIARLDREQKRLSLLSIPRDTRVQIPGYGTTKINAASVYGGPSLMISTVKELTGVPISHYVEVDFAGFVEIVDILGGVEIEVPARIYDPQAANWDPSGYVVEEGLQRLDGKHALTFVRSRKFPEGDFQRIRNQQAFLRAMLNQMLRGATFLKATQLIDAGVENATTDMSTGEIVGLARSMWGMSGESFESATIPSHPEYRGGASYVIPDEPEMAAVLAAFTAGESLAEATGESPDKLVPQNVTVTVRNGCGKAGVAAAASRRLELAGFDVRDVGNTNQFVYKKTLVIHKDDNARATLVRQMLGIGDVAPSRGMYSFNTDVLVVVGSDWTRSGPRVRNVPRD